MKRKEIKQGDQIKFFGAALKQKLCDDNVSFEAITFEDYMPVFFVSERQEWVHIKNNAGTQFVIDRRQVTHVRRKKQRREFWIKTGNTIVSNTPIKIDGMWVNQYNGTFSSPEVLTEKPSDQENYIHVREVKK